MWGILIETQSSRIGPASMVCETESRNDATPARQQLVTGLWIVLTAVPALGSLLSIAAASLSLPTIIRLVTGKTARTTDWSSGADSLMRAFNGMQFRLRLLAAVCFAVTLIVIVLRRPIRSWIQEAILPLPGFIRSVALQVFATLRSDEKLHWCCLLALFLLGIALRLRFLFDPVGFDEADTILSYASRPLYVGLAWYPAPNNHLFHTLLLHLTWRLLGDAEWAIRLPALCAGALLIPVTYWAARSLYGRHPALLAAAMVAGTSSLVSYSVNARGYTLVSLFFLILLIAGRYLLDHESKPAWLLWALAATLGLYTIPIMLYCVGTVVVWLTLSSFRTLSKQDRRRFLRGLATAILVAGALTCMLYMPVLIASAPSLFGNTYVAPRTLEFVLQNALNRLLKAGQLPSLDLPPVMGLLLAGCLIAGLLFHRRTANHRMPVPLAAVLFIPAVVLAQRVVPFTRVWLFLVPLYLTVAAAGLWFIVRSVARPSEASAVRLSAWISLCCFVPLAGFVLTGSNVRARSAYPGIEKTAVWLKAELTREDTIVVPLEGTASLAYYMRRHHLDVVRRSAPCDGMAVIFRRADSPAGRHSTANRRLLPVIVEGQTIAKALTAACLPPDLSPAPRLIHLENGIGVYEAFAEVGSR